GAEMSGGLKHFLSTRPLTVKLVGLVALVVLATTLTLSSALTWSLTSLEEQFLKGRATNVATLMATLASAAIEFENPKAANDRLSALANGPDTTYAAIYAPDGAVIAQWGSLPPSPEVKLPVSEPVTKDEHDILH